MQSLVLEFYELSPLFEKVRPVKEREWTVLAAFILQNTDTNSFSVVSLATGTKSIGRSLMNVDGYLLNDCHAEVLAR